ncbi:MAG: inositol monophosphatase family protein [Pseudomonadota bacterium]
MTPVQHSDFIRFSLDLAAAADAAILPLFRSGLAVDNKRKAGFDPVTAADRASEEAMRALIEEAFPQHGILGEEFGAKQASDPDGLTWVLDPIDGTRAFICGLPTWMTLIGLCDRSRAIAGCASQAYTGERFFAGGNGSWHRDRTGRETRLEVRPAASIEEAIFCSTSPDLFGGRLEQPFHSLRSRVRMARFGGDAYLFCLLAAGSIDIVIDPGLQAYDIAALVPIIEQAGGVVTTLDGASAHEGGDIVAAASSELHEAVCNMFASPA